MTGRGLAQLVALRTPDCAAAADTILHLASGDPEAAAAVAASTRSDLVAHVSTCLRCQAETAAYRRVRRSMLAMRAEMSEIPPGYVEGVLETLHGLDEPAEHPAWAVRAACVGGITAAGVLVWRGWRHTTAG